jgi:hypothetical protein
VTWAVLDHIETGRSCRPPASRRLGHLPDDLPSPDEFRKKMAHVDQEFADARRYLSALCAEDNQALGALMAEIHRSGRAMKVLAAMAVQALDFAHLSADRLGGDVQKWLDESVMAQDTAETSGTKPSLAARDNPQGRTRPMDRARCPVQRPGVVLDAVPSTARGAWDDQGPPGGLCR